MTKYKLIKEFPGSAPLGTVIDLDKVAFDITYNYTNYPEFWKKVEEKEYEILEYQSLHQKGIISKSYYNTFVQMKSDFKIYSVKRLSDGEIFKLGDLVNYNKKSNYGNWKINNFIVKSGIILARSENNLICESIIDLKHIKIPILITEDGVELFEGDCFYFVDKWFECWNGTVCDSNIRDKYKHFSTSEAAEKYIEENKPTISKKQLISFLDEAKLFFEIPSIKYTTYNYMYFIEKWLIRNGLKKGD